MANDKNSRKSLAQHFAAPDEYIGEFGWLCGYSADAAFMALAAQHFSAQSATALAAGRCRRLGLLLDRGNPQLSVAAVPGVLHFPALNADLPFVLLHAKVAVLGYRRLDNPNHWQLRVLVSTGNWTRATLEGNIDLAWRVDIDSRTLDATSERDCADLAAAWNLLGWLRRYFDTSILAASAGVRSDSETRLAQGNLERWAAQAARNARGTPRLIDNRSESLWGQVLRMAEVDMQAPHNYLAIGSAYFEGGNAAQVPAVLQTVVNGLQQSKLLTASATVDVYVNPGACQAVAHGAAEIAALGWTVRPPRKQDGQAFMHAKFILSAKFTNKGNSCMRPWLYFGSGNLTSPGLLQKASRNGGNVEAGVMLKPEGLLWSQTKGDDPATVVENLLPVQWTQDASAPGQLHAGGDMPERCIEFMAPPVSWLLWQSGGAQGGRLIVPERAIVSYELFDGEGAPCPVSEDGSIAWPGVRPLQLGIRWTVDGQGCQAQVPVIDEQGGIGTVPVRPLALEDIGWELFNFPAQPDHDDGSDPDDPQDLPGGLNDPHARAARNSPSRYPIRSMMEQLELIAQVQCEVDPLDWRLWCSRLEQTLCRAGESDGVAVFRALAINPLSALLVPAFRPAYAESSLSEEGARYEAALERIALAWKVNGLSPLGEIA